jgi:tetratricopeptide (TPR) repeat protein
MNFEKLKDAARKFEQKEDWRRAIEVYLRAIQEFEAGNDPAPDLSIYNRVGDLYLKANEPAAAVQAYERAADLYLNQGFYNNAIALCGKILRVNPGRVQVYLKLARLHASKNVVIEAKKNLLEYLDRMNASNQLDEAFKAMKDFADHFPGNKEIRLMLSDLLRASSRNDEAKEQLEKLASDLEAMGDSVGARKTLARIHAISGESARPAAKPKGEGGDLVFLDLGLETPASPTRPPARKTAAPRKTVATARPPEPQIGSGPAKELELVSTGLESDEAVDVEPLEIETSSLAERLEIESVQPISDEAVMEMTSLDVGKALGFEPTLQETDAMDRIAPLEGLEIDTPPPDTVELGSPRASQPRLADTAGLDEITLAADTHRELDLVDSEPRVSRLAEMAITPFEEAPELVSDVPLELERASEEPGGPSGAEEFGLDLLEEPLAGPGAPTAVAPVAGAVAAPSLNELEERVFDDPDNPETHRALGEALIAAAETERGASELDLAIAAYEAREDWQHAVDVVHELIRLEPNAVRHYQKMVELAYRTGDRGRLLDSYLELGDALMRAGAVDKALAVYRRVLEHDPGSQRALVALQTLAPVEEVAPPPPPKPAPGRTPSPPASPKPAAAEAQAGFAGGEDFVDLGRLILDESGPRDTRMRVEDEEPTGDEQRDFNEMLSQFKRGIDENIEAEDFQSHYDLGVAFKEMGLLDEAIAEFQKALRSPEGRLRTSEALGVAFFEKGQFAIAEAILKRAVESLGASDDEQIGLIYWLGRGQEAQGKVAAAVANYERVLAVDIGFQDTSTRMARLAPGGRA